MLHITDAEATDFRSRGLIGFIVDGDKSKALKALATDDTGMIVIEQANGNKIIASIVQTHPLTRRPGHDEKAHFDRAQYLDRTTDHAPQMTAIEVSVRSNGDFEDPHDGANQRRDIESMHDSVDHNPKAHETTVDSVHPENAPIAAEPMPQADGDKPPEPPKPNPEAKLHSIGVKTDAAPRSDTGASA